MSKIMLPVVVLALTGCASTGEWRALRIDGSSATAFNDSLAALNAELSESRRGMLRLALADIERTQSQNVEPLSDRTDSDYTYDDLRRQLDGMTYDGVIALADQTGRSIATIYYAGQGGGDPWDGRPWPQADPYRFPSQPVMPSGPGWTQ